MLIRPQITIDDLKNPEGKDLDMERSLRQYSPDLYNKSKVEQSKDFTYDPEESILVYTGDSKEDVIVLEVLMYKITTSPSPSIKLPSYFAGPCPF